MSASDTMETNILKLILQNVDFADIGDATGLQGSSTAGNLYVGLHTGDPTDSGDQESNEANYTGYSRVAVARSAGGWSVSGDTGSNVAAVTFGECTAGPDTITHFSIGTDASGAGTLLFSGTCSLSVTVGVTPEFGAGDLTVTAA